jgi:hypothetical protein
LANRLRVRKASIDFQQAPSPTTTGTPITKAFLKFPRKDTLKQSIIVNVGGGGGDHQKIKKKKPLKQEKAAFNAMWWLSILT